MKEIYGEQIKRISDFFFWVIITFLADAHFICVLKILWLKLGNIRWIWVRLCEPFDTDYTYVYSRQLRIFEHKLPWTGYMYGEWRSKLFIDLILRIQAKKRPFHGQKRKKKIQKLYARIIIKLIVIPENAYNRQHLIRVILFVGTSLYRSQYNWY